MLIIVNRMKLINVTELRQDNTKLSLSIIVLEYLRSLQHITSK